MNHHLRQALERAAFIDPRKPRVAHVSLPTSAAAPTVKRRAAEHAAVTLQPVTFAAPRESAADVHRFVMEQFPPKARRLAA